MIIDFEKIKEEVIHNLKGGEGELDTRNFVDENNKIMLSKLKPGASSGYHVHEQNCEIVYIISGEGYFKYDNIIERINAGKVHYCPKGHGHSMVNDGRDDLVYLAIVPELR